MALGAVLWELHCPNRCSKHGGDGESLQHPLSAPREILGVLFLEKADPLARIASCWEGWHKKQQMEQEILTRENLAQKVLIKTWFCLAKFRAELQPQASLVCAFVPLDVALSLSFSFFLSSLVFPL